MPTTDPTKPTTSDLPSSEDQPVDMYFSSSEEADSDSPFPDSSDSESETTSFQQGPSVRVSSKQKHNKPATEDSSDTKPITAIASQKDEVKPPIAVSTAGKTDAKMEAKSELPDGWTGAEVTYFRMLHPVFGHNYCTMAEMIRSKTCREVYEYGRVVSTELLQQHGDSVERQQLGGKKKKRNMRWTYCSSETTLYICTTFNCIQNTESGSQQLLLVYIVLLSFSSLFAPGHGLTIIARYSPNSRARPTIATTTPPAYTQGSHVTTPVHVWLHATSVKSIATAGESG